MDITAGNLTLRPNSAAFSPKPGQQDLALLNLHLQERYAFSTLHNGLLYRAVVGAAVADLMTRDSPTASTLAEHLLRQTIDAARLAWIVDRAGGRPQVRLSQPLLSSQGVWYGPAEQVLNQRDLSAHCDTHSAAYMQAQYPLHVPQDGYWDGLEACLYAAPMPIMLPPHVRLVITDIRGRRQSTHATPILWDAQVPAGHHNATAVYLSHPEASIGEVPRSGSAPIWRTGGHGGQRCAPEHHVPHQDDVLATGLADYSAHPAGRHGHGWINRPPSGGQPGPMGC
ncbi:hypothetical protein IHN32_00110 [Deinococcus sp. 14RED07]|uniref:hypothetical protein n=1 Tax=Deinococcus sp. 14RED07 TaxID=2745874 RepID=UPI001E57D65B|nr:hypothetical protein [Deinococcus sp. 14RED07]MCD0174360.1 hypothetical protein [Deinococcus sp. 14RED07]